MRRTHPETIAPAGGNGSSWRTRTVVGIPALLVLIGFALFFAIPALWLLLAATKTDPDLVRKAPLSFGSLEQLATNWRGLFAYEAGAVLTWLRNSAVYAVGGTAIAIVAGVPAGYGLACTQFVGRRLLLGVTLLVMIMPGTALVLPVFLELNAVHLVSSAFAVILPFSFFPFGVYLSYIYFDTTLPANILSASAVDGCSPWQTFRYVALPMARPVVALVAFFSFVADWNNFFLPFIMLPQSGRYPIQVGLTNLLASTPAFNPGQGGTDVVSRPEDALAILLSAAPVLLVFLFAQRFLTSGLLAGAVKE